MKISNRLVYFKLNQYLPAWLLSGMIAGIILSLILNKYLVFTVIILSIFYCIFFTNRFYTKIILIGVIVGIIRMLIEIYLIHYDLKQINCNEIIIIGKITNKTDNGYLMQVKNIDQISLRGLKSYYVNLITDIELPMFCNIITHVNLYKPSNICLTIDPVRDMRFFLKRIIGSAQIDGYKILENSLPNLRLALLTRINNIFTKQNRDFIHTILFGINSLNREISDKFRRMGISHLLAISGLHFTLFGAIFYLIGRWIIGILFANYIPMQYVGIFMSIVGLLYYFSITNISWSVMRSLLTAFAPIIALTAGRAIQSKDLTLLIMFLILIISPQALLDPGFQLSFIAVITLLSSKSNMFISTALVLFTTAPYSLYYFGYTNLQPFLANIICVPYFSFIVMPLIVIGSITGFPLFIVYLTNFVLYYFFHIIDYLNQFGVIEYYSRISIVGIILFSIGLILFILLNNIYITLCLCLPALFIRKSYNEIILISNDGYNIVYLTKNIIYTNNLDSFYSKYIQSYFIDRHITEFPESMKQGNKIYKIKDIVLYITSEGRFNNARKDGQIILSRWMINHNKVQGLIKV